MNRILLSMNCYLFTNNITNQMNTKIQENINIPIPFFHVAICLSDTIVKIYNEGMRPLNLKLKLYFLFQTYLIEQ